MPFARFGAFRDFLIFPSFPTRGLPHGLRICLLERVKHAQIAGPLRNGEPAAGGGGSRRLPRPGSEKTHLAKSTRQAIRFGDILGRKRLKSHPLNKNGKTGRPSPKRTGVRARARARARQRSVRANHT